MTPKCYSSSLKHGYFYKLTLLRLFSYFITEKSQDSNIQSSSTDKIANTPAICLSLHKICNPVRTKQGEKFEFFFFWDSIYLFERDRGRERESTHERFGGAQRERDKWRISSILRAEWGVRGEAIPRP